MVYIEVLSLYSDILSLYSKVLNLYSEVNFTMVYIKVFIFIFFMRLTCLYLQ